MLTPNRCVLDLPKMLESIHRDMEPGEAETSVRCPYHGEWHNYRPHDLTLENPRRMDRGESRRSNLPPIPKNAGPNYCRWHRTAETWLFADCAYCGVKHRLHVHLEQFGHGKANEVIERCPACHRNNLMRPRDVAVWELRKQDRVDGAVIAMRLDGQGYARQKELAL